MLDIRILNVNAYSYLHIMTKNTLTKADNDNKDLYP